LVSWASSIDAFMPLAGFRRRVDEIIHLMRSCPAAPRRRAHLVPGEIEHETGQRQKTEGIPINAGFAERTASSRRRTACGSTILIRPATNSLRGLSGKKISLHFAYCGNLRATQPHRTSIHEHAKHIRSRLEFWVRASRHEQREALDDCVAFVRRLAD
jgi:hypothetical protein